jgi:hypothetical protein
MLAVPADRLPAALADLDPGNRALLDLSLRRGVSDAEIGELLRKDPDEVSRGRDAVLGLLADALDLDGADRRERVRRAVSELPDEAWRGAPAPPPRDAALLREAQLARDEDDRPDEDGDERPEPAVRRTPPPGPERDKPKDDSPLARGDFSFGPPAERRSSRGRALALIVTGLILLAALGALLLGGGDDDGDDGGTDGADRQEPAPPRADAGRSVAIRPLAGGRGSGRLTAARDGRFVITLRGLPNPDGTYQAWLYNSVVDAIPLGTFREGSGRLPLRLPARAGRYRFLDVSLEPADSNRNHSGDTVLRAPLAKLLEN